MNYIVLDMEWNQPYTKKQMIRRPTTLHGEIIQIGAVKVSEDFRVMDTFKIMVAPKYYRRMNEKVTRLTRISNEDLRYGFPFPIAIRHFIRWCGEEFIFLTWGTDDLDMLYENLKIHKLKTGWIPSTYDIQAIYADQALGEYRQVSLTSAIESLSENGWEAHDALNDAWNTVYVCQHLDIENGIADYESIMRRIRYDGCPIENVSEFEGEGEFAWEVFEDPDLIDFLCPNCGTMVTCGQVVRQGKEKYICIAKCAEGHELFVRFQLFDRKREKYGIARLVYDLTDSYKELYDQRILLREKKLSKLSKDIYAQQENLSLTTS